MTTEKENDYKNFIDTLLNYVQERIKKVDSKSEKSFSFIDFMGFNTEGNRNNPEKSQLENQKKFLNSLVTFLARFKTDGWKDERNMSFYCRIYAYLTHPVTISEFRNNSFANLQVELKKLVLDKIKISEYRSSVTARNDKDFRSWWYSEASLAHLIRKVRMESESWEELRNIATTFENFDDQLVASKVAMLIKQSPLIHQAYLEECKKNVYGTSDVVKHLPKPIDLLQWVVDWEIAKAEYSKACENQDENQAITAKLTLIEKLEKIYTQNKIFIDTIDLEEFNIETSEQSKINSQPIVETQASKDKEVNLNDNCNYSQLYPNLSEPLPQAPAASLLYPAIENINYEPSIPEVIPNYKPSAPPLEPEDVQVSNNYTFTNVNGELVYQNVESNLNDEVSDQEIKSRLMSLNPHRFDFSKTKPNITESKEELLNMLKNLQVCTDEPESSKIEMTAG